MKNRWMSLALAGVVLAAPLSAAPLAAGNVERLSYKWRLKGGLSWLARLAFPSSGNGFLETREGSTVNSKLVIHASDATGYYLYESQMMPEGATTLATRNAYAYGDDSRDERVAFDVTKGLARIDRKTSNGSESKVRPLESSAPQDVLTSIYYLRQHADEIRTVRPARIFSGAKGYDVVFQPMPVTTMRVGADNVRVRPFTIRPIDNGVKRFPGEVRVWISDDDRRVPVRIDIEQKYATLKLELQ